jgi:putative ABC transport system permease protein
VNALKTKLRRDMRASLSRFVLMVIAIAVSLTVFGGVLMAWAVVNRETSDAYLSTEPASATIVLEDGVDPEIVGVVENQPQVLAAAGRTQFDSTVEVNGSARTQPLQVFVAAPDDPMRIAKFGRSRPGEILLGADGTGELLGATVGDTITLVPPGADPVRLRVAGTVYDPSLAPSPQEQRGHAYLSSTSLPFNQLKIQVADQGQTVPSRDRGTIVAVASEVGALLRNNYGLAISEIQVPTPYAHPHQWQSTVLLLSLLAGAAAALLLAAILVATMLNTLFTRQIPQIGIMKAIGARSVRIGRFYVAMTLLVAAAATVLAIGAAIWAGRELAGRLLEILGIQPVSLAAPLWTYLVITLVGLGLPPLLALVPVVKASRITVRAAIDHHGAAVKPSAGTTMLARLARLRRIDRGLVLALRNTVRRPARFWLSVGLLACAGTVFVAAMSLRSGTQAREDEKTAMRYWDVEVQLAAPAEPSRVTGAIRQLPGIAATEVWTREHLGVAGPGQLPITRTYPDQGHGSLAINTIPADTRRPPPDLVEGRWLNPNETGAVVLTKAARDATVADLGAGDTVRLFIAGRPTTWRIAGIAADTHSAEGGAYTTAAGLAAATGTPQHVNRIRVITTGHDEHTRHSVAAALDRALTAAGVEVELASSVSRTEAASTGHAGPVFLVLLGVAVPLGVLGAIGLAATMSANILDRTREFGILHAIGARPKTVRRIVIAEGVILAITSCLIAALPTLGLTALLGAGLGNLFGNAPLPLRISGLAVGIWLTLVVLGAILATDAAATRASRLTVREALSYL